MLEVPDDVRVVAVLAREEPRDVIIPSGEDPLTLQTLPADARVCVAGGRRRGFLHAYRPDVRAVTASNGEGPAGALRSGSVDAVILGSAEARRLALRRRASEILDPKAWVPGPGQGTVLLVARADDDDAEGALAPAGDPLARTAWLAESAVLAAQGVSGDAPIGVMASPHGKWIRVWGMVASLDGTRVVRGDVTGNADDPESAGRALAELLVARGVAALLRGGGA
jgi:hydroxymethylbilane synthase